MKVSIMQALSQIPLKQHMSSRVRDSLLQYRNCRFDEIKLVSKKGKISKTYITRRIISRRSIYALHLELGYKQSV